MRKAIIGLLVGAILVLGGLLIFETPSIFAEDPVTTLQREIDELEHLKQLSVNATTPLEKELSGLESRIKSARNGIVAAKNKSIELASDIESREEDLAIQYHILSRRIAEQYKRSRTFSPIMTFLATKNAAKFTKDMAYRSSVKAQDNRLIEGISQDIEQLEADRVKLEQDQVRLAALEKQLDEQADFFRVEIKGAKDYQAELSGKIADLSARQQEIINTRSGTFTASIGDSELARR